MNHDQITLLMEWAKLHDAVKECTNLMSEILSEDPECYDSIKEALEWYTLSRSKSIKELQETRYLYREFSVINSRAKLTFILTLYSEQYPIRTKSVAVATLYEKRREMRARIGAIKRSLLATGRALNKHSIIAKLT